MEQLITAQALWKDYDPFALPLGETVLSEEVTERYTITHLYFNGEATADGCTRVYARLYTPASIPGGASVVMMNDIDDPFNPTYINLLTDCGYTVLALDYAGKRSGERFTIYPESLCRADFFGPKADFLRVPTASPKLTSWYIYACVMMRGYAYLYSRADLDKNRICLFGVRRGAMQVYKAAYVLGGKACAAVALFNSSYVPDMDLNSDEAMKYLAALTLSAYASLVEVPLYILDSSNNHENSLLKTSSLYQSGTDKCRLYIAEHSDNNLGAEQRRSLMAFINDRCYTSRVLPLPPALNAHCSDRALYYEVRIDRPEEAEEVSLFYSYGRGEGQYRNWKRLKLERVSEDEYIVKADVYLLKEETSAFVTVRYRGALALSSPIVTKTPLLMGVAAKQIVRSRLVYDTDMGTDDWLITKVRGVDGEISIVEGGNGIKGVTSSVNSLTTLKIGDESACGDRDSLLQLLIYSFGLQTLDIEVTCRTENGYCRYTAMKRPEAYEEWTKITLSAAEFKSPEGPMPGWDSAVSITVGSESKLLISSLLWI